MVRVVDYDTGQWTLVTLLFEKLRGKDFGRRHLNDTAV